MLEIIQRIVGLPVRFGGQEHVGWLPPGAATPLPTPVQNVLLNIEIEFDGHGYLLCYSSQDGSIWGDDWHETLAQAEQAAEEKFGAKKADWRTS